MKHFIPPLIMSFEFDLWEPVTLAVSGEIGVVVGRRDSVNQDDEFLVRYQPNGGSLTEVWWDGTALDRVTIH